MATYSFRCDECGDELEVEAPMGRSPGSLPCATCGGRASRLYMSPRFSRSSANAEETFNPQLGIAHRNDAQAREHIKKLNDTEDTHYVLE